MSEDITEDLQIFATPLETGYKQAILADKVKGLWTPFIIVGRGIKKNFEIGLSSYPNAFFFGTDKESKYVRKGQYKLIVWSDRTKEFCDLKDDPLERKNLAQVLPMIVNELYQRLVSHEVAQLRRVLGIVGADKRPIGRVP